MTGGSIIRGSLDNKLSWRAGRVYSNQGRSPSRRPIKKGCKISALQVSVFYLETSRMSKLTKLP